MPPLSERDLGHVEKLYKAIRSVIDYDKAHRRSQLASEAVAPSARMTNSPSTAVGVQPGGQHGCDAREVVPSSVLQEHQQLKRGVDRDASTPAVTISGGGGGSSSDTTTAIAGVPERRLWTELAFLMWRVVGVQKLSLVSYVTNDAELMLTEIARALLDYLKETCAAAAGAGKEARMGHIGRCSQDRLLFLLRVFCSLKNCTTMLSGTSGRIDTEVGRHVFDIICRYIVDGQHLAWMAQVYVWFCDEAARMARVGSAIPSAYVYAAYDALKCIWDCCAESEACAMSFMYSEPVAYITYMFYGIKLRISGGDLLRPYEDDRPLEEAGKGGGGSLPTGTEKPQAELISSSSATAAGSGGSTDSNLMRAEDSRQGAVVPQRGGPVPLRPGGARPLKTAHFGILTTRPTSIVSSFPPPLLRPAGRTQGSPLAEDNVNTTAPTVAASSSTAAPFSPSQRATTAGDAFSTSWAFNLPDLQPAQLKALIWGGRANAFDALVYVALDVVLEVMRMARSFGHWMVLTTVSNLLLLSKKSIEVDKTPQRTSSASAAVGKTPQLSQIVAMYENITVLFQLLFSMMECLDRDSSLSAPTGSPNPATAAALSTAGVGAATGAEADKKLIRKDSRSTVTAAARYPGSAVLLVPEERVDGVTGGDSGSGTSSNVDVTQLREFSSQQLLQIVLQTDVHEIVAATTRVVECDRSLFRVLHSFCVLDTQRARRPRHPRHGGVEWGAVHRGGLGQRKQSTTSTTRSIVGPLGAPPRGSSNVRPHIRNSAENPLYSTHDGTMAITSPLTGGGWSGVGQSSDTNTNAGAAPMFDAAKSFFVTSALGDLRQAANDVGKRGGVDGGGTDALRTSVPTTGSGCMSSSAAAGVVGSTPLMPPRQSPSKLCSSSPPQSQRRGSEGREGRPASPKARSKERDGGASFAKSFFKSFFGGSKSNEGARGSRGVGALHSATVITHIDAEVEHESWNRSPGHSSSSSSSGSSDDSEASSDWDDEADISQTWGMTKEMLATAEESRMDVPLSPKCWGNNAASSVLRPPCRLERRKPSQKSTHSSWRRVPSYVALVSELVRIFNLVLADTGLSAVVRLGTGLLLPSIVLRDTQVFRLYEGRVLIRNFMELLLAELKYNSERRASSQGSREAMTAGADVVETASNLIADAVETSQNGPPLKSRCPTTDGMEDGNGAAHDVQFHFSPTELVAFVPKVIEALEQTFKVLGVVPLVGDVMALTELAPYFFNGDDASPVAVELEHSFTRVAILWLIGLVGAQCDEDVDRHAMEVLLRLMTRATARGSLPKDSGTTLMVTPSGASTVVQVCSGSGVAVPTITARSANASPDSDWGNAKRKMPLGAVPLDGSAAARPPSMNSAECLAPNATMPFLSSINLVQAVASDRAACPDLYQRGSTGRNTGHDSGRDAGRGNFNHSLFDTDPMWGLAATAGMEAGLAECGNTVESLCSVFRVLLGRSQELLSPPGLATILSLFLSHDSNLSRLGRECMTRSLEAPPVYPLYADVILGSETYMLTQTLSVLSAYLNSPSLAPVPKRERRLWMQRYGCVDAVIRVLARVLDSPQSTPNFMKAIPHLFQFLSAFESGDHKPPQLHSTNFIATVAERLVRLEGTEYFIIVAQAVLDASMGTYGGVDYSYTNAGGPGTHFTEMHVVGSFHVALYNCAAEKPIFLELLPSLLAFAETHNEQLYANLVEVLFRVLECTSTVRSDRLADFILDHGLSQLLPHLELSGRYVEERLPFTGTAVELHRFWQPILAHAPRRSELRFTSHGGVQVNVGLWPAAGFSIIAWFKFDRLYTTIPLFEFHGVLGGKEHSGSTAATRSVTTRASLFVFGGDSMQLSIDDGRTVTLNKSQGLQNFTPHKWLHVCAVVRATHVIDVYVSGWKIGTAEFPYFTAGAEVCVNVGCTDDIPHHVASLSTDAAPLFSMSDISLWAQALSQSQVEAELSSGCDSRTAVGSGRPSAVPVKISEEGVPQEITLLGSAGVRSAGAAPSSTGAGLNFSAGGVPAFINTRTLTNGSGAGSFDTDERLLGLRGEWPSARLARFVPYENEDNLLRNVIAYPSGDPVIAKLVGRYATPPKTWVDYPLLWATRGGVMRLLDWLHFVTSTAQLEAVLQLITECVQRTTLAVTSDPRTYILFGHILKHDVATYITNTTCDQLLNFASSSVSDFDEEHRVILNRLAFEHILGDVNFYMTLRLDTALYLLQRVRRLFHTSQCRYARHNARFVQPFRLVDRLLHSLIGSVGRAPLALRRAVVQVAQQVVAACDMEDGLVQVFVSLIAILTPEEMPACSQLNTHARVVLPVMRAITRGMEVPLRAANHLTTLLLTSLLESTTQSACLTALAHTIDLPWYAASVSHFADPAAVVYATRLFFEAVQHNPLLQEEVAQHQSAIVEVLTQHAVHEDLILLLLGLTFGATRHVDVLSRKHSLLQQLDSLLRTFTAEPNTLVAPIFVRLLIIHLQRVIQLPWRKGIKAAPVLQDEYHLSHRLRRCFSLARVCGRIMIWIHVRRYRVLLARHGSTHEEQPSNASPSIPMHAGDHVTCNSQNISFTHHNMAAVLASPTPALGNASFASVGMSTGGPGDSLPMGALDASPLGIVVLTATTAAPILQENDSRAEEERGLGVRSQRDVDDRTPFDGIVGTHRRMEPAQYMSSDRGDDESSCAGGDTPQWKPPVLLPEMGTEVPLLRSSSPTNLPSPQSPHKTSTALAMSSGPAPAVSVADTAAKASAEVSARTSEIPVVWHRGTPLVAQPVHWDTEGTRNTMTVDIDEDVVSTADKDDVHRENRRIRSSRHPRAFAVLRVCVLLWLPLQVRRCCWALAPYPTPSEVDFTSRHAGALFCVRMLRHFAALPSYFYLFVNSPLQTAALASLVHYIPRDMLQEYPDHWDVMVRAMSGAPARAAAARVEGTPAAEAPPEEHEAAKGAAAEATSENEVEEEDAGHGKELDTDASFASFEGPTHGMASLPPALVLESVERNRKDPNVLVEAMGDGKVSSVDGEAAQKDDVGTAPFLLQADVQRGPPYPAVAGGHKAESSLMPPGGMAHLESPEWDPKPHEEEDSSVGGKGAAMLVDSFIGMSGPPSIVATRLPRHRKAPVLFPLESSPLALQSPLHRDDISEPIGGSGVGEAQPLPQRSSKAAAALVLRGAEEGEPAVLPGASTGSGGADDDASSESPASSASSMSQSLMASSIFLQAPLLQSAVPFMEMVTTQTAAQASQKPAVAPAASSPYLQAPQGGLHRQDGSDAHHAAPVSTGESAREGLRRDTAELLRGLIRASLDTLPVPHWIAGPTYGSCGGLLFQLLFILSARAAGEDSTTTLVRFFLTCVGDAVKEQRDREMVQSSHQAELPTPLKPASASVPSTGLGNPVSLVSSTTPLSLGPFASPLAHFGRSGGGLSGFPDTLGSSGAGAGAAAAMSSPSHGPSLPNSSSVSDAVLPMTQSSAVSTSIPFGGSHVTSSGMGSGPNANTSGGHLRLREGAYSDVFLFNVSHFTDLMVDMLAINVLDLPLVTHFFLTLLVLCQGWPSRYVDQLSWQVMRACIAVLNRPSMQDASLDLIESIYTLSTLVLRRGWKHKGVLESLLRVLYRVFEALPPAWMPDADARHRRRLITLIIRHMVRTYRGTKELAKALTVRTLTQRLSLYDDFQMVFSLNDDDECCETFEQYCVDQYVSLETLMTGRLKVKADLAFKASIKTRSEYIKRIKAFNEHYVQASGVAESYRPASLRAAYLARFSSYVCRPPHVDDSQLHWLLSATCTFGESHATTLRGSPEMIDDARVGVEYPLYHFLDQQMNYGELKGVCWGAYVAMPDAPPSTADAASRSRSAGEADDERKAAASSCPRHSQGAAPSTDGQSREAAVPLLRNTQALWNDVVHAAACEECIQHIAVLVPPFCTYCRPHIGVDTFPAAAGQLRELPFPLTPSAMTLLRYLVEPHETLRFLSNGFRVSGIHATPCLILLTNTTLKVIGFSRLTEAGDIVLCEQAEEENDDEEGALGNFNRPPSSTSLLHRDAGTENLSGDGSASPTKTVRKNPFSMSAMTRQFQKIFSDNTTKRRQEKDGTRVAQAVRQVMGRNYQNVYWSYLVSSIRAVRCLRYMHLDTAVQLLLYHDHGPMLSVVDAKQSMNPSARKVFLKVLKEVVGSQRCTFVDETQRASNMKSQLVRWATRSLSNYAYLHFLNEAAGRTTRDLNQYPVFPWVLADYTSSTLDLEAPSTFRNFGYPMGAQTEARRVAVAQLFENTREVFDPHNSKSYPFHHGTHYSTSAGVLYFLLRVQPFTTYARLFQGGDFDLAMRLFDSIAASFASCVAGPADCKELIPEFYVSGGFLRNADRLPLGVKSDGQPVDDVRLPPWAKNSRQVFTAVMRYALECPHVVEQLHQWIDLVFGVRRRGPLAMERSNVFQRMTYGEEVAQALQDAETPHDCDVIIAEVDNFGQTPPQLFQERHPSHHELAPVVRIPSAGGAATALAAGSVGSGAVGGASAASGGKSALMLGSLYASAAATSSAAAAVATSIGNQAGVALSNLVASGAFGSGHTYTQAFCREAPKVTSMLIHAMDETQRWFALHDPPSGILQHPPPTALTDMFRVNDQAVLRFSMLRSSKRLACVYAQMVPVPDTDYYLCWHEREAQLMRYSGGPVAFQSVVAFHPPDASGARISAVAVGPRESVLLIASSSGAVYCLFPDDVDDREMRVRVTLCHHRSAVRKIALDSIRHRAVTIASCANGHAEDDPVLWRVQRSGCTFLNRLRLDVGVCASSSSFSTSYPPATSAAPAEHAQQRTVVDVAFDVVSGHIAIVTARSLFLFDHSGESFGAGTLPSPTALRAAPDAVVLEDDNGDVGVVVNRPVCRVADLTAVGFYQTNEWASGMAILLTGHQDGSIALWRTTRLPPDTVSPGRIAIVEFHARLFTGAAVGDAPQVASGASTHPDSGKGMSRSAEAANTTSAGASAGTGTTFCPVTSIHQDRPDLPMFLIGYANGVVRQLLFEDPTMAAAGAAGGTGGALKDGNSGGGYAMDERNQH